MRMVGPEYLSEDDKEVRRILREHPLAKVHMTRILLSYHDLVTVCIESMLRGDTDTADIQHSLAKKQNALYRMGIIIPGTERDTTLVCAYHLKDATTIYSHTHCSLDPLWLEPEWVAFELVPLEAAPQDEDCCVCQRDLRAEPPYTWNAMSYGEVYRTIREREQKGTES